VVGAFETKTQELQRENSGLRDALARLQQAHQLALEQLRAPAAGPTHASSPAAASAQSTQRRRWSGAHAEEQGEEERRQAQQQQQQLGQHWPSATPAAAAAAAAAAGSPEVGAARWGIVRTPGASTPTGAASGSDRGSLSDGECGAEVVPSPRSAPPPAGKAAPRSLTFESPGGGAWGGGWLADAAAGAGDGAAAGFAMPGQAAGAGAPSVGDLRARMHEIKLRCRRQLSVGVAGSREAAAAQAHAARPEERLLQQQLGDAQALVQEQDRVLEMMLERLSSGSVPA
jgi:hypothetical protein